jgi:hypothetical protein
VQLPRPGRYDELVLGQVGEEGLAVGREQHHSRRHAVRRVGDILKRVIFFGKYLK